MTPIIQSVSVVVPTYREAANIESLTKRLFETTRKLRDLDVEILIVDDDSGEETRRSVQIVDKLKNEGYNVKIRVRRKNEGRGLSSAVLLGLKASTRDFLVVMDADLQHEVSMIINRCNP